MINNLNFLPYLVIQTLPHANITQITFPIPFSIMLVDAGYGILFRPK